MQVMPEALRSMLVMALPYVALALWLGGAWWIWVLCDRPDHPLWLRIVLALVAVLISSVVCAGIALALVFAACRGMQI